MQDLDVRTWWLQTDAHRYRTLIMRLSQEGYNSDNSAYYRELCKQLQKNSGRLAEIMMQKENVNETN